MDEPSLLKRLSFLMDAELFGHHKRVAFYSGQIASVFLPEWESDAVLAASVHDVGKIGIPEHIFQKQGHLTEKEWELIRLHPLLSVQILRKICADKIEPFVIEGVRHHHERWDGSGYPADLQGEEIPLLARILAVADSFDAMTSFRPYRASLSMAEALEELKKHSGTQFAPAVVDVFVRLFCGGVSGKRPGKGGVKRMEDMMKLIKQWADEGEIERIFALLPETADPAAREAAVLQLMRCGAPQVVDNFILLLSSPEAHLRSLAVEALQELGAGYLERLEELLFAEDQDLKILSFNVLSGVKSKKAAIPVRRYLEGLAAGGKKDAENTLAAAVECLGEVGEREDVELLKRLVSLLEGKGEHSYLLFTIKEAENKLCLDLT
ncbi:MAG: HD domain-containing phosphohydrolase [Bacillota bacterium]